MDGITASAQILQSETAKSLQMETQLRNHRILIYEEATSSLDTPDWVCEKDEEGEGYGER